jgi:ABC-2 type transport system ATP-binding protein
MQKRLSLARAMITSPPLLLIDEATHDLDPEGAQRVRALVEQRAAAGTAVLWTTQRVEEVRAFAHTVTLLNNGRIRFDGTVAQLLAHYVPSRHIVTLRDRSGLARRPSGLIDGVGRLQELGGGEYVLQLEGELNLGNAATGLAKLGWDVLACRAERPEIEEAFLRLTETEPR